MDLTKQEALIQEAIRRYPPGTVYWNLDKYGKSMYSKYHHLPMIQERVEFRFSKSCSEDGNPCLTVYQQGTTAGWVYSNGIWADIYTPIKIHDLWI